MISVNIYLYFSVGLSLKLCMQLKILLPLIKKKLVSSGECPMQNKIENGNGNCVSETTTDQKV